MTNKIISEFEQIKEIARRPEESMTVFQFLEISFRRYLFFTNLIMHLDAYSIHISDLAL